MKLIKKIAAIMLSVMMVLGMASVVSADEGGVTAPTGNGKITITNAKGSDIYDLSILELESYDKAKIIMPIKQQNAENISRNRKCKSLFNNGF